MPNEDDNVVYLKDYIELHPKEHCILSLECDVYSLTMGDCEDRSTTSDGNMHEDVWLRDSDDCLDKLTSDRYINSTAHYITNEDTDG